MSGRRGALSCCARATAKGRVRVGGVVAVAATLAARFDRWYLVDLSDDPRGLRADALAKRVASVVDRERLVVCGKPRQALAEVAARCGGDDVVVVFGSFLTVSAAMAWLEQPSPN